MGARARAAAFALALGGCTFEATEVLVVVGTDLPDDLPLALRVRARRGGAPAADGGVADGYDREWRRARPDASAGGDGGVRLPASFGVVPRAGGPRDELVTITIEGESGALRLRRVAQLRFVPGRSLALRVFLTARCLAPDARCRAVSPCTRAAYCEERGQTCGDDGECVAVDAGPLASLRGFDAAFDAPTADVCPACDAPPPAACAGACRLLTYPREGACVRYACEYAAVATDCPYGCDAARAACVEASAACVGRDCGAAVACGGVCRAGAGCCTRTRYRRSSGLGSGNVRACCDAGDARVGVTDCGVGANHYAQPEGDRCGVAGEGAMNGGSACVELECERATCG